MAFADRIKILAKQLLPTGRAFKMPPAGDMDKLYGGMSASQDRSYADALSTLNSIIPDNADFTTDDATAWERRYGLISNDLVSLADRKAAILRKMNSPGAVKARQNYRFLEGQLRLAGFDVYVYENRFPDGFGGYVTEDPLTFTSGVGGIQNQLADHQLGDAQLGAGYTNFVANYIDEGLDAFFDIGSNLRSTFFVGGTPAGSFANVPAIRKDEFRQLILRIKPVQTVGYLLINYV